MISSEKGNTLKENSTKTPLLIKPLNKPESIKIISNQPKNTNKLNTINGLQSQKNLTNQNINNKPSPTFNQDKKNLRNNTTPPIKSPAKPLFN